VVAAAPVVAPVDPVVAPPEAVVVPWRVVPVDPALDELDAAAGAVDCVPVGTVADGTEAEVALGWLDPPHPAISSKIAKRLSSTNRRLTFSA
jgi:hypothetical protein